MLLENTIHLGDCLQLLKEVPAESVDLVLCDLPYGTTGNKWDSVIPMSDLWVEYLRVGKENCAYVLTGSQPFTTALINSNPTLFRYEIIWDKTKGGNFALARRQPMKSHENILLFYRKQPTYNPQMETRGSVRKKGGGKASDNFGIVPTVSYNNTYYPKSIVTYSTGSRVDQFHPTQKPQGLFEYLIKTYSNPGDLVLDNCAGSGTTAMACKATGRRFICIEKDPVYWQKAVDRVTSWNG